jgi:hypothetical protein
MVAIEQKQTSRAELSFRVLPLMYRQMSDEENPLTFLPEE